MYLGYVLLIKNPSGCFFAAAFIFRTLKPFELASGYFILNAAIKMSCVRPPSFLTALGCSADHHLSDGESFNFYDVSKLMLQYQNAASILLGFVLWVQQLHD